ncbi:hypothetical protein WJX84_006116 [Apatococcus fuscideae]|uniref:Sulfotransferase n=1 Tax=Apatococcus fuscideae TaxID=2026836 RepID=A0AAW1TJC1_9CHLO
MQLCQSSGLFSRKLRPSHLSRPQIVVRLVGRPLSQNPAQNLLAGGQVRQLFGDMVGRLSVLPPGYSLHMAPDTEGVSVCKPAEERHIVGCSWDGGRCYNGECEGLHLTQEQQAIRSSWAPSSDAPSTLIIAAGPERSGSTWLFNAVRLLYEDAQQPLDSYWMTHVTTKKLHQRGHRQPGSHHILVKTHGWSNNWDTSSADHILLTHRHLSGVLRSYQRVGWAFDIPESYIQEHQQWKAVAHADFAFEEIIQQPLVELQKLAQQLSLLEQVDLGRVQSKLDGLQAPASGPPDPVSKLWPQHMSPEVSQQLAARSGLVPAPAGAASSQQAGRLQHRFPTFFEQYGYS